jgi:hypothetical protein
MKKIITILFSYPFKKMIIQQKSNLKDKYFIILINHNIYKSKKYFNVKANYGRTRGLYVR